MPCYVNKTRQEIAKLEIYRLNPSIVNLLPTLPKSFDGYNDYQAKKQKRGQLSQIALSDSAHLLIGMLSKPLLNRPGWTGFSSSVEGLALTMLKYSELLKNSAKDAAVRQSLDHVVRPLGQFSNIQFRSARSSTQSLTEDEQKLQGILDLKCHYEPVLFDELAIIGKEMTPMQRYRFLKSFQLHLPVEIYSYNAGGSVGSTVFMWKVSTSDTQDVQRTKSLRTVETVRQQIPKYHTQEMRRRFASQCSNLTGITPQVRSFMFTELTGDASAIFN